MKLKRVEITNFKSYKSYIVHIRDGLFNIWGLNGQGKTNLQLAIRLGLGWSPPTGGDEYLENAIHEDEEQCRITLIFDNSENTLRGYTEEVVVERRIIRGNARPQMRMSNNNGDLVPRTHKEIREDFSKIGYNPDDPGIFIEQGDLRSFCSMSFSQLLEKCIGLAGLRNTYENVIQTERKFSQIENVKKEAQKNISEMEDDLDKYRPGYDAHKKFNEFDEKIKRIELENKTINYLNKRIEFLNAQKHSEETKATLEKHKSELESVKQKIADSLEKVNKCKNKREKLEETKGNLKEILDGIYSDRGKKLIRQKELEELLPKIKNYSLPPAEEINKKVRILQQKINSAYSNAGKQVDELEIINSQLSDIESGLVSSIVPPRQKDIKKRLVNAGIKTEFLSDCLEIKKGAESFREKIEILLDPFKFHLVIQKKDLQNVIEILKDGKEISMIVPDDWPPNNYNGQSIGDYLVIKKCAPEKLQNFINYFTLNDFKKYGPNENVFLDSSVRFHRIHLNVHPKNKCPAIGEEGRRISRLYAKNNKLSLENSINKLNLEIKQIECNLESSKISLSLAEKKPFIKEFENELNTIKIEISELNDKLEKTLSNHSEIDQKIGELTQQIQKEEKEITIQNLPNAKIIVLHFEKHYHDSKKDLDELKQQAEFLKEDSNPECINKFEEVTEKGLIKRIRKNSKIEKETKTSIYELEKKFTRAKAIADFNNYKDQKSLIEEKKDGLKKQQQQAYLFKEEWDKAQQKYKIMVTQLFNQAGLIFRDLYKNQDSNANGLIIPNFKVTPPELEVRINLGKRNRMVNLNEKVGGPSGGEKLAAVVNLIFSILKARSQLAKVEPDIFRPQPFIFIDEPQQDMDDPAFRNGMLNFKGVMGETQILILTHKPLPDPELFQLWLFLHPELGTIGKSHQGEIHKIIDKNAS